MLASADHGNVVRLWNLAGPVPRESAVLRGHHEAVTSTAFSPDGDMLATVGSDRRLIIWDVAAGKLFIEEAGGRVTYYDGSPFSVYTPPICASNGLIHAEMLEVLK